MLYRLDDMVHIYYTCIFITHYKHHKSECIYPYILLLFERRRYSIKHGLRIIIRERVRNTSVLSGYRDLCVKL